MNRETPKAKLARYGRGSLTNRELLSLILQTGSTPDALSVAESVFTYAADNSIDLTRCDAAELEGIPGIGPKRASQIVAAMELSKRLEDAKASRDLRRVSDSEAAARIFSRLIGDEEVECFAVFFTDTRGHVLKEKVIGRGSLSICPVVPRDIYREALKCNAAFVFIGHNHPSGETVPSQDDIDVTRRVSEAGKLMGIKLQDHLIVGGSRFTSLRHEGYLDY